MCFGQMMQCLLFKRGKDALLINKAHQKAYLFVPSAEVGRLNDELLQLLELKQLLTYLQNEQLVTQQPFRGYNDDCFFYEDMGVDYLRGGKSPPDVLHQIKNDLYIKLDVEIEEAPVGFNKYVEKVSVQKSDKMWLIKGNNIQMESYPVNNYADLHDIFCSIVHPTQALRQFKKNGYLTDDQHRAKQANRLAITGVIVAIVIAALSLLLTDRCVRTTINEEQYKGLTNQQAEKEDSTVNTGDTPEFKGRDNSIIKLER